MSGIDDNDTSVKELDNKRHIVEIHWEKFETSEWILCMNMEHLASVIADVKPFSPKRVSVFTETMSWVTKSALEEESVPVPDMVTMVEI